MAAMTHDIMPSRMAEIIPELFKPEDFQRPAVAAVAFGAVLAADSQDVGKVFPLLAQMLRPGAAIHDPWIPRAFRFMMFHSFRSFQIFDPKLFESFLTEGREQHRTSATAARSCRFASPN